VLAHCNTGPGPRKKQCRHVFLSSNVLEDNRFCFIFIIPHHLSGRWVNGSTRQRAQKLGTTHWFKSASVDARQGVNNNNQQSTLHQHQHQHQLEHLLNHHHQHRPPTLTVPPHLSWQIVLEMGIKTVDPCFHFL
jgi:hypothetical protein